MSKFYVYYNYETEKTFCTVYEWSPEDSVRRYCSCVEPNRYTHQDIQLDTEARILTDKRTGDKYALIEPRKEIPNLQYESVHIEPTVDWAEAF